MSINNLLCHIIDVEQRTLVDDTAGGSDITWSSKATNVRCRIWTPENVFIRLDSGESIKADRNMATALNSNIEIMNRILFQGLYYYVYERYSVYKMKVLHHYEFKLSAQPGAI